MDIISRASVMFDKVIVAVLVNSSKKPVFTAEERIYLLKKALSDFVNVEVQSFDGLLVDYARQVGASAVVRGLRAVSDFEYEFQMSLTNKKLYPQMETIFLTTRSEYMFLSSSIVKQIAVLGGDITNFVPECIHQEIKTRLSEKK
ncbi:MAG: pantetheine-phosphate adenylyltransferase [Clostridia bacterium]|nr:pantetheine-phosphate adenylyltransferase [Clostridia bacterium]